MAWAAVFTAMILNHGFLCFLMFSGFNKCLTKYETQGTAADRCGKCKLYTFQTQWQTWLKHICRKKTYSPKDVSSYFAICVSKFLPALECDQSSEWQQLPAAGPWLLKHSVGQLWPGCQIASFLHRRTKDSEQCERGWSTHSLFQEWAALKGDKNSCIISVPTSISQLVGQPGSSKSVTGSVLSQNISFNQREHKMRFFSQNSQINFCKAFLRTCWENHNSLAVLIFFYRG